MSPVDSGEIDFSKMNNPDTKKAQGNQTCTNCGHDISFHIVNIGGCTHSSKKKDGKKRKSIITHVDDWDCPCKSFKAPENAGCGKCSCGFDVKKGLMFYKECPKCKNAGDDHSPEEEPKVEESSGTNASEEK